MEDPLVTISIISHGQATLVEKLLGDLDTHCKNVRIVLTYNLPEEEILLPESLSSRMMLLRNPAPKGFGANHNEAFEYCDTPYFCILNPDIRLIEDPYEALVHAMVKFKWVLSAPLIINTEGTIEDSCRYFPTPWSMILRKIGLFDGRWPYDSREEKIEPHWLAGMFLLFEKEHYKALSGFDERYYMYCEDIDLCARTLKKGLGFGAITTVKAIHDARRDSSRSCNYFKWHLGSLFRFWCTHLGRLPRLTPENLGHSDSKL
jgi:GT2 family glycosyltransferase